MDGFSKMTKELQKKEEKQPDVGIEVKAEATCNTEGVQMQNTEEKTSADDKVSGKLLGKRAGKPSPTDIEQDLKKKKMESKAQDVAKAGSSKGEGKASKKKKKQEQEVFNVPQTPPRANDGPAPTTPEGRQQPPPINPIYTPARPKTKSRLIKDEPLLEDSTKLD
ncbi:uncharacterized protein [Drosophila kikkawai]|uniref:Uncharacterized protein n=1 Tax=Drosophila kikkawai TaxID=30033 RepID=A0A6P4J1G4_DROKI|nr:uncharacterized protein LOC108083476 [Drosophila kikkawai]